MRVKNNLTGLHQIHRDLQVTMVTYVGKSQVLQSHEYFLILKCMFLKHVNEHSLKSAVFLNTFQLMLFMSSIVSSNRCH